MNANLSRVGGHIGYGLRPSARGKRLAPVMLALCLKQARALGLDKVLLTCNAANLASSATIKHCGGQLADTFAEEDGNVVEQYWILLS